MFERKQSVIQFIIHLFLVIGPENKIFSVNELHAGARSRCLSIENRAHIRHSLTVGNPHYFG